MTYSKLAMALGLTVFVAACGGRDPEPVYTPAAQPAPVAPEPTYSKY